jgi:hypothetical protein
MYDATRGDTLWGAIQAGLIISDKAENISMKIRFKFTVAVSVNSNDHLKQRVSEDFHRTNFFYG